MTRLLPVVLVGLAALALGLAGCENDAYSDAVQYGLRVDPLLIKGTSDLGDPRDTPDRPGQLPLQKIADLDDPRNPLHEKRDDLRKKDVFRDPTALPAALRAKIEKALDELFGTPARPTVKGVAGGEGEPFQVVDLDPKVKETLKLSDEQLARGSKLYRQHCVHCHGVQGNGRGPTAQWVNPHPRDFRQGLFKFQSVDQIKAEGRTLPPRRDDLVRTVRNGLEGTAMPSFALLGDAAIEDLVSYVTHLSLRGKAEFDTLKSGVTFDAKTGAWAEFSDEDVADVTAYVRSRTLLGLRAWVNSQDEKNAIQPAPYPKAYETAEGLQASIQRGQWLFNGEKDRLKGADAANCKQCHTSYGRASKFRWDEWGTLAKPANFTQGVFRGGRRPVDIYHRIHSGINGSGMNLFGEVLDRKKIASMPADVNYIWDLVNFVQTVSDKAMRERFKMQLD